MVKIMYLRRPLKNKTINYEEKSNVAGSNIQHGNPFLL